MEAFQIAIDLLVGARIAVVLTFVLLAVAALVRVPRNGTAGGWVAGAFGVLALAMLAGLVPDGPDWLGRAILLLFVAFPYLLVRFTASFRDLPRWIEVAAAAGTLIVAGMVVADSARFESPVFVIGALTFWVLLTLVSAVRLWRAGRDQPTVARRRMRLMAVATVVLAVAVVVAIQLSDMPWAGLLAEVTTLVSGLAFALGFNPPRGLRRLWRRPEEERLSRATIAVMRATTPEEVARALLRPTVEMVGAGGAQLLGPGDHEVAVHVAPNGQRRPPSDGASDATSDAAQEVIPLGSEHGALVVWPSVYSPFFGHDDVELLRAMGAVASLALERADLLRKERERRENLERMQAEAERARADAERANLAKSEFLSRMSHELRTPLNAVLGFGQLLLQTSEPESQDSEFVGHILKAGRHLLALIDDVLDLSRVEAGNLSISLEPVELTALLEDALTLIRPMAAQRSIDMVADVDSCAAFVLTDRQRFRQVLLNLLSNAVKYNHDGGRVDLVCERPDDTTLRILVRDTGPGIDPARQDRVFEPFERLGAEASQVEGTGLGLALSKQLVERCGGQIGVDSAPGRGTTFWVDLPLTDSPGDQLDGEPVLPVTAASGERTLLLVEDNLDNLKLVEAILRRREGVSVLTAMQGGLGIDLATEHRPDMVMLDLHLPDMSGRDVLARLKADPRTRDIPVVIFTADATQGRLEQLTQDGAFDFLTKPIDVPVFLDVVESALQHAPGVR